MKYYDMVFILVGYGAVLLLMMSGRLPKKDILVKAMAFGVIFLPLLYENQAKNFIPPLIVVTFVILERLASRNNYSSVSRDQITHSVYYVFRKAATICLTVGLLTYLSQDPVKWGFTANGVPFWAQAIFALFVFDFKAYLIHRGQHASNIWWRFHKVHHATKELSVMAGTRTNILEFIFVQQLSSALLAYVLGMSPEAYAIGYLLAAVFFAGAVAHCNIDFPKKGMPWFGYILMTPNVHGYHHTVTGDKRNFGEIFTLWDVFFGTFYVPKTKPVDFGVDDKAFSESGILAQQLHGFFPPKLKKISERASAFFVH